MAFPMFYLPPESVTTAPFSPTSPKISPVIHATMKNLLFLYLMPLRQWGSPQPNKPPSPNPVIMTLLLAMPPSYQKTPLIPKELHSMPSIVSRAAKNFLSPITAPPLDQVMIYHPLPPTTTTSSLYSIPPPPK